MRSEKLEFYTDFLATVHNDCWLNKLLVQLNLSVTYLNLHNYPQAYRLFLNIQNSLKQSNVPFTEEMWALYFKTQGYLCLIDVAACNYECATQRLNSTIESINSQQNNQFKNLVYEGLMKILFGYKDIEEIIDQSQLQLNVSEQALNPNYLVFILALAQQMMGNLENAYHLSYNFYKISKKCSNAIFMLLSCKHLKHISQKLFLSENIQQYYTEELATILELNEFYGLAEETIFRNYSEKLECGAKVFMELLKNWKKCKNQGREKVIDNYWLCKGLIEKIRLMKRIKGSEEVLLQDASKYQQNENNSYVSNCKSRKNEAKIGGNLNKFEFYLQNYNYDSQAKTHIDLLLLRNTELTRTIQEKMKNKLTIFYLKIAQLQEKSLRDIWKEMLMLPPRVVTTNREHKQRNNKRNYCQNKDSNYQIEESLQFQKKIHLLQEKGQNEPSRYNYEPILTNLIEEENNDNKNKQPITRVEKIDLSPLRVKQYTKKSEEEKNILSEFEIGHRKEEQKIKMDNKPIYLYNNKSSSNSSHEISKIRKGQIRHNRNLTTNLIRNPNKSNEHTSTINLSQDKSKKDLPNKNSTENLSNFFKKNTHSRSNSHFPTTTNKNKQKQMDNFDLSNISSISCEKQSPVCTKNQNVKKQKQPEVSDKDLIYSKVVKVTVPQKQQQISLQKDKSMLVFMKKSKKDHKKTHQSPTKKNQKEEELKQDKKKKSFELDIQGSKMISTLKSKKGENKMQKLLRLCKSGQYFIKRHYSSDGGSQKFVRIEDGLIKWAVDEDKMNSATFQSYKLMDVKGIVFGAVTNTFKKDCNKKLQPWKCFSLILQKRTLDFYCSEQIDPYVWVPGISYFLQNNSLKIGKEILPSRLYSPGRVLWKKMLLKLQNLYIKPNKKNKRQPFKNANAYAIIQFGKVKFEGK